MPPKTANAPAPLTNASSSSTGEGQAVAHAEIVFPIHSSELKAGIASIVKTYGKGSIMRWDNAKLRSEIAVIPTGLLGLDFALGVGGFPRGRVAEVFGRESSGKTTLMLQVIASVQEAGGLAAFIDADHAFDPVYAKKAGVNLNNLLVCQPNSAEEALTTCETLAGTNSLDVIIIDSVSALGQQAAPEAGTDVVGKGASQAPLISRALPKLTAVLAKSKTACVFTKQSQEKEDAGFGDPRIAPDGSALKFYASVRLEISREDTIKDSVGTAIGNKVLIKVAKNKFAPPMAETQIEILYHRGMNKEYSILDAGIAGGAVDEKGAWLQFEGELIAQGRDAAQKLLVEKPELTKKVVEAIMLKRNGALATR